MVVVGAIIGAGIFLNPAIVAQRVGSGGMILAAWALGGVIALLGALCFAELGGRLPRAGGGYVYLREAYGPLPAFLYGWTQLLVINTGGIAAVAVTFAAYGVNLVGGGEAWIKPVAVAAILLLSAVNAAGVRFGALVQNTFTLLKLVALALLVVAGAWVWVRTAGVAPAATGADVGAASGAATAAASSVLGSGEAQPAPLLAMGTALVAVLFAYGGWQHANNIAEEIRNPVRSLPRALLVGVAVVVTVYVLANVAYLAALGPAGLAGSTAPAADALGRAFGGVGRILMGIGVVFSTFGILNVFILSAPRIYREMAADGLFFRGVARLNPRTRAPVLGILIQAVWAVTLALSGTYAELLDWVVFGDWIFFGLIAATLFTFRRRDGAGGADGARDAHSDLHGDAHGADGGPSSPSREEACGGGAPERRGRPDTFRISLHPLVPGLFVLTAAFVVFSSVVSNPRNAMYGALVIGAGVPVFLGWRRGRRSLP